MKSTKRLSAEDYASSNSLSQQKAFDNFLSLLNITEGMKGVDIGCGAGVNTAILAEKVGNEGVILGIDPDKDRINVAQKKYEKKENLKFFTAKSNDIPTGGEDYDFIVSNYVMHWVPEHEKVETYKSVRSAKTRWCFWKYREYKNSGRICEHHIVCFERKTRQDI